VDLPAWGILLGYLRRSVARVVRFLHPRFAFLHLGMEDVAALGRLAGIWSSLAGLFPARRAARINPIIALRDE